jgi:hypothetical protein
MLVRKKKKKLQLMGRLQMQGQGVVSADSLSRRGSWHNVSVKKEKRKKRKLTGDNVMLKAIECIERVNTQMLNLGQVTRSHLTQVQHLLVSTIDLTNSSAQCTMHHDRVSFSFLFFVLFTDFFIIVSADDNSRNQWTLPPAPASAICSLPPLSTCL